MSYAVPGTPRQGQAFASPARRVRHQARDVLAVMAFSAATSVVLCLMAVLALTAMGQG